MDNQETITSSLLRSKLHVLKKRPEKKPFKASDSFKCASLKSFEARVLTRSELIYLNEEFEPSEYEKKIMGYLKK